MRTTKSTRLLLVKDFLEENYQRYNRRSFIETDPISIPHKFSKKADIEISAFLAATISWGNRKSILNNAGRLMDLMDNEPYDFVMGHSKKELMRMDLFAHRTFNGKDCTFFIKSLKNIYSKNGGLENAFGAFQKEPVSLLQNIMAFRNIFLTVPHLKRSEKHISNPLQKSSAKRICMFLRWMVRNDNRGVDFGIWKNIPPSALCLPLDIHSGNVSRSLGILTRKINDWQAVEEVTGTLKEFDPNDPVKYDFALFGLGVNKVLK